MDEVPSRPGHGYVGVLTAAEAALTLGLVVADVEALSVIVVTIVAIGKGNKLDEVLQQAVSLLLLSSKQQKLPFPHSATLLPILPSTSTKE